MNRPTVRRQGVSCPILAKPASALTIGDRVIFNQGGVETVIGIEDKSPATMWVYLMDARSQMLDIRIYRKSTLLPATGA